VAPYDPRVELRPHATPLGFLALAWLALANIPNTVGVGARSAGAMLTLLTAGIAALAAVNALSHAYRDRPGVEPIMRTTDPRVPAPLVLFGLWAMISMAAHPSTYGVQNVAVYVTFVAVVFVTSRTASAGTATVFLRRFRVVGCLVAVVYLGLVVATGAGTEVVYSARAVALALVIALAVGCAVSSNKLVPLLLLTAIVLSLSRTASVVAVFVLFLSLALRGRYSHRIGRILLLFGAGFAAAYVVVSNVAPLRDRFFGGDQAVRYDGLRFNTSGRTELWSFTWHRALEHPWFGGGPGDAQNAIIPVFGERISHPHNDFLRLFNDLGVVGVGLFILGLLMLMRRVWVRGKHWKQPIHVAAFLALFGATACAITDNVLVYSFVMVPLGVIVGLSLAYPIRPDSLSDEVSVPEPDEVGTATGYWRIS
jgi:O-antigen ligase